MSNPKVRVTARSNDSVAIISWTLSKKIAGCLGFAVTAINQETGERQIMRTHMPFKGTSVERKDWRGEDSTVLPIQARTWLHYFGGKPGTKFTYEVVPMVGKPGELTALDESKGISNEVTFTTIVDDTFAASFTRGILSTQWLAHTLPTDADGLPDWQVLVKALTTVGDPLRNRLTGNVPEMLMSLVKRAREIGGKAYLALYELADPELIEFLCQKENLPYFELILGNTGDLDETNAPARKRLHDLGAKITDRMVPKPAIAHNKFVVLCDKDGKAIAVLTGSTNWTFTGLGCQANMAVVIENASVAELFLDYFGRMKVDGAAQGPKFRADNAAGCKVTKLANGATIEVWFSPNTPDSNKDKNSPMPPDLKRVKECIDGAKEVACGEVFYPGNPSVIHWMADKWNANPQMYMFMTVSSAQAMYGVKAKRRKGRPPMFVIASARERENQLANFVKELLKLPEAHAITHGKILVIDPFGDKPVVIFGSHNLGFKASYANDENLVIVTGHKALAQAVFVNMYQLYAHFMPRSASNFAKKQDSDPTKKWGTLDTTDGWQDQFTSPAYKARVADLLTTGVWDGSGLVDPDWLKPVLVIPPPKRNTAALVGEVKTAAAVLPETVSAGDTVSGGEAAAPAAAPTVADTNPASPETPAATEPTTK